MNHLVLAIHGAIADLLAGSEADGEEKRAVAARYLPVYRERDGPEWVGLARSLMHQTLVDPEQPDLGELPTLDEALDQLGRSDGTEDGPGGRSSSVARFLVAVAILVRIEDAAMAGDRHTQLVTALSRMVVDEAPDRAEALLDLIGDDDQFGGIEAWEALLDRAIDQGLLPVTMARVPAPCQGTAVVIADGVEVAQLRTVHVAPELTVAQVAAVLDPQNWPACSRYFCAMTPLGRRADGWDQVLEEASTMCGLYRLRTGLAFYRFARRDGGVALNYDLCVPQPQGADGLVVVDRGTVIVRPIAGGGVEIRTTKQVRFALDATTALMAAFACLAGWGDAVAEALIGGAAAGVGTHPWRVSTAPVDPSKRIDEIVARTNEEIDAVSLAWSQHLERAARGGGTVAGTTELVTDLAARTMRGSLQVAELALRLGASAAWKSPSTGPTTPNGGGDR